MPIFTKVGPYGTGNSKHYYIQYGILQFLVKQEILFRCNKTYWTLYGFDMWGCPKSLGIYKNTASELFNYIQKEYDCGITINPSNIDRRS